MSDAFSSLDRQRQNQALSDYINAMNGRIEDENKVREENAEQKAKDNEYNETLQSITDPFAQELIRKPVEELQKKAVGSLVNAFKARANKSLNSLGRRGVQAFKKSILDRAKELGVDPQQLKDVSQGFTKNTTLGEAQEAFNKKLDSLKNPDSAINDGAPAQLDEGTKNVIDSARANQGNLPRGDASDVATQPEAEDEEPQLIDAFTGKPIESKPIFDLEDDKPFDDGLDEPDEFDDWTADLYDKPITQSAPPPNPDPARPPPAPESVDDVPSESNPFSFDSFTQGKGAFGDPSVPREPVQSRLSRIFKSANLDDAPNVDFTGRSSRITQPKPPPSDSVAGDVQTQDSLAPMRDLMKNRAQGDVDATPQFTRQQQQQVMDDYRRTATDPPPKASDSAPSGQPEGGSAVQSGQDTVRPEEVEPKENPQPTADDDQGGDGAGDVVTDAEKAGDSALKTTAEEGGEDLLGEIGADTALIADPLTSVIGLVAGLGTLLGGIFGGHHHADKPVDSPKVDPTTVNPTDQVGVN